MNVVLSFGDLAPPGGYRTRVLGELNTLDRQNGLSPFLLVFDRNPRKFEKTFASDIPHKAFQRSDALRFFGAVNLLSRKSPIRVVHAHNLYSALLALASRRRYGYKVILDYHGRIPEEYVFLGKGGAGSRKILEFLEAWCVRRASHIVVVSEKLQEYLIQRYRIPSQRLSVIPCCADEETFNWNPARREAVRQSMNLAEKLICTHIGSFVEWYDPEMLVNVFRRVRSASNAHLLVITADVAPAHRFLSSRLSRDLFTVRSATHEEAPGLLNASDIGFLLLRSSPNIRTSSPAKFAEYLNCGAPVLITPEVGDFTELVMKRGVGAVVDLQNNSFDASVIDRVTRDRAKVGAECVSVGRSLTWQRYYDEWARIVRAC